MRTSLSFTLALLASCAFGRTTAKGEVRLPLRDGGTIF